MKNLVLVLGFLFTSSAMVTAQAECNPTPPDEMAPLAAYSIFNSNYKGKDYQFALKFGRWMLCSKPADIEGHPSFNLSIQLSKFVTIYKELAKSETDPGIKAAYLDSAVMVLDDRIELAEGTPADKYRALQDKGRFYLENYSYITDGLNKAYTQFQMMFDLDPKRATTSAQGYYVDALLRNYINKREREKAQAVIDEAMKHASPEFQEKLKDFQKDLFGSPEDIISYYAPILEAEPNNTEALKALADAYEDVDNREELVKVRRKLHEVEPTFESAMALAETERSNARYAEAIALYKEALNMASNDDDKKRINVSISDAYINMNQIKTADRYVEEALKIDSNYGQAYINKARIYAQAISTCIEEEGRKMEAQDRVVYWLVIDYLNMAKAKDPSVASTVNSQLPNYEAVTPTAEDKFLKLDNLQNGQKVKIDGSLMPCYSWINKTTTVR